MAEHRAADLDRLLPLLPRAGAADPDLLRPALRRPEAAELRGLRAGAGAELLRVLWRDLPRRHRVRAARPARGCDGGRPAAATSHLPGDPAAGDFAGAGP